ncbi:hypothetical protein KOR42_16520 [Thalassoglobus neptunius]|uniref:Uncharacterized protein n=1 Tax=Thalassoglobus neptunius TaxID=1938619 RepID=A0A5C5X6K3_9PLAN|nr:hypothetical protein KOR42_16520 [Thalassoglobus neptunius]
MLNDATADPLKNAIAGPAAPENLLVSAEICTKIGTSRTPLPDTTKHAQKSQPELDDSLNLLA